MIEITTEVVFQKFQKLYHFGDKLLETEVYETPDKTISYNPILAIHMLFSPYWGVSMDEYDDPHDCLVNGQKNLLGYALIKAREKIRSNRD